MQDKTRILLIDDHIQDHQLFIDELQNDNPTYKILQADNREKFELHLQNQDFDIALSNTNIFGFDDLKVLETLKDRSPDIPVIITARHASIEMAVKCIKMGAADYISKSAVQLHSLVKAVRNELEYQETKNQSGKQLIDRSVHNSSLPKRAPGNWELNENKNKYCFEQNPMPMWIYNLDTLAFLEINDAAVQHYGYSRYEFLKMHLTDIYPIEDVEKLQRAVTDTTKIFDNAGQWRHIKKNGDIIYVEIISHSIEYDSVKARLVLTNDVTEQRHTQEQLRKLSLAVQQNPASILITDVNGSIEYVNPKFSILTGYEPHEVIGKNPRILKSGATSSKEYDNLWQTITSGREWQGEFQNCKKNGEIYIESASISPIADEYGSITHFIAVKEDITEKKHAEKLIKTLSRAIEQSPVSTIITNEKGKIEYVNTKFTSFMQYPIDQVMGRNPRIFNPQHSSAEDFKFMWDTLQAGMQWSGEHQNRKKDGTFFWENVIISPLMDNQGRISNYILIMEDISEKKKMLDDLIIAKEKAEVSEEIFSQFMKHSPIYVFFKDENIRPILLSNNYEKMLGLPLHEMIGKTMFELFPSDLAKSMVEDDLKILNENKVYEIEEELEGRYYTTIKFPIHLHGKPRFLAGFTIDISERKNAEILLREKNEELIRSKDKTEESDRLKTAFLANMSHEIRTPMNGILGFTELLKTPKLSGDQQQEFIDLIKKSGDRLLNIINNIIDISKIEAGQVDLSLSVTDINEQIRFIHSFFRSEAEQKRLQISYVLSLPNDRATIHTDSEKIYAILTNLVKNALKFTKKGFVTIGYELKKDYLEFYVRDTGPGISHDQTQFIFERFRRGNESLARNHEGAGLGLSITKAYVEIMGGKIWVESVLGVGSTFYFTIPYTIGTKAINKNHNTCQVNNNTEPIRKLKILIVEDDDLSAMLISEAVRNFSIEIILAGNGVEAIDSIQKFPDIDLILMDISMPVMDGLEATRRIRLFNKNVIIIAQTAFGLKGDREKAIEAGCNAHISKPIKKADLAVLINNNFNVSA